MSGVFKAIGKVFKKVVKVVKKVALPALMIGAVVLTGGAAIGALPALGTMLGAGGLGLSAGLTSVLGGAISSAAVGTVMGGITGGWKGAKAGFLGGALTGGVMGGLGMISPNGVLSDMGIGSKGAHMQGLLDAGRNVNQLAGLASNPAAQGFGQPSPLTSGVQSVGDVATQGFGSFPSSAEALASIPGLPGMSGAATGVTGQAAAGTSGLLGAGAGQVQLAGGGLLGGGNAGLILQGLGPVLSGLGGAANAKADDEHESRERRLGFDRATYNYGYQNQYATDKKGRVIEGRMPTGMSQWFTPTPINLKQASYGGPGGTFQQGAAQPYYQIVNGQVVLV